jgi:hypothetical protein
VNLATGLADIPMQGERRFLTKLLIISVSAAVALLAATVLPAPSLNRNRASVTPVTISLQELQSAVDVKKLPTEDFEDQSLVYSTRR